MTKKLQKNEKKVKFLILNLFVISVLMIFLPFQVDFLWLVRKKIIFLNLRLHNAKKRVVVMIACLCVNVCACVCVFMCVCVWVCVLMGVHVCVWVCVYDWMYVCECVSECVCVCYREWCSQFWNSDQALIEKSPVSTWSGFVQSELEQPTEKKKKMYFLHLYRIRKGLKSKCVF